jgi:hypothetical protein
MKRSGLLHRWRCRCKFKSCTCVGLAPNVNWTILEILKILDVSWRAFQTCVRTYSFHNGQQPQLLLLLLNTFFTKSGSGSLNCERGGQFEPVEMRKEKRLTRKSNTQLTQTLTQKLTQRNPSSSEKWPPIRFNNGRADANLGRLEIRWDSVPGKSTFEGSAARWNDNFQTKNHNLGKFWKILQW